MNKNQQAVVDGWAKFLNPATLRTNLVAASVFLAAWETLMSSVVVRVRDFFCIGYDENGETISDRYREVLAKHREKCVASLLWYKEMNAIDDDDMHLVERIRIHRNAIAHELPSFVASSGKEVDIQLLFDLCKLVTKIDRWWILNVELDLNPEFDDVDRSTILEEEVSSGNMMFLSLLLQTAAGDDEQAIKFYQRFTEAVAN